MGALEALRAQYEEQGLAVLGFYSNDFGNQGGDPGDIDACTDEYDVNFLQFGIDHVTPEKGQPRPVFAWLFAQPSPGPSGSVYPTWNFHKYLIGRDGTLVAHWDSPAVPDADDPDDPNDIPSRIQAELAKPAP